MNKRKGFWPLGANSTQQTLPKRNDAIVWAITADQHINSTVGLCPPRVKRDAGGTFKSSREQGAIYECWLDFWENEVASTIKREGAVLSVSFSLGDAVDKNQHNKTELVIYDNDARIVDMAEEVFNVPKEQCDLQFFLRGTEAHTGTSGYVEEILAMRMRAVRDEESDTASWNILPIEMVGVSADLAHHAQTYGWRPWTRDAAAARQAAITWSEYHEMGLPPPDIVGRAHGHYWGKGYKEDTWAFYAPPWQLTTTYARRRGAGRKVEPVGGVIIVCRNGEYTWRPKRYRPKARRIWTLAKMNCSES